jgi:hypothetical protein
MPVVNSTQDFIGVIRLATVRDIKFKSDKISEDHSKETIGALGDLYHIGLAGLLRVATDFKSDTYDGK